MLWKTVQVPRAKPFVEHVARLLIGEDAYRRIRMVDVQEQKKGHELHEIRMGGDGAKSRRRDEDVVGHAAGRGRSCDGGQGARNGGEKDAC